MLLASVSRPHVAFLGRIPGTNRFSDLARHPKNERVPGTLIFRVESSLLYFNVDHVLGTVRQQARLQPGLKLVICDLSNVPYVDVAGARMLKRLHTELAAHQIDLRIVEAHATIRDMCRAEGLESLFGSINRFTSLAELLGERQEPGTNDK
jgi:MFS superfamily sulfate permease-like transporter